MLLLFIGLGQGTPVHRLVLTVGLYVPLARRKEPHEVSDLDKLSILVNDGYSDDVIVGIDLMHDSTHHSVSLSVLNDVIIVASTHLLDFLLVTVALHVVAYTAVFGSVRPSHEQSAIDILALGDDERLSLLLDLVSDLLDELSEK